MNPRRGAAIAIGVVAAVVAVAATAKIGGLRWVGWDKHSVASASAVASAPSAGAPADETPADRGEFAEAMAHAAREASPGLEVDVEEDAFALSWTKGDARGQYSLERAFREYEKLGAEERPGYVTRRARTVGPPSLPATLAEAGPKLVPLVRERIDAEVARIFAADDPALELPPEPPHVTLTDALWGVLGYDAGDQFVRIDAKALQGWGTTFDVEWPKALARLEAASARPALKEVGGVHEVHFTDGNDSARVLVPAILRGLGKGELALATPDATTLLLAAADDARAVTAVADRLVASWDEGPTNARMLRLDAGGKLGPLVGSSLSPSLAEKVADLESSAAQRDERLQREALQKRYGDREDTPFVASLKRMRNPETGDELAFVVHTEQTTTLLPRGDWVVFRRVDLEKKTAMTIGCGPWERVFGMMKERWKETPLRPARWLATDLPSAAELRRLGCAHPVLRMDLGVARPTQ